MATLRQLAGLSYDPAGWGGSNLRVQIKDKISYNNARVPPPFLPTEFPASESKGLWSNTAFWEYIKLCRLQGSVPGIETRRDENNVDWKIGNGFEKK